MGELIFKSVLQTIHKELLGKFDTFIYDLYHSGGTEDDVVKMINILCNHYELEDILDCIKDDDELLDILKKYKDHPQYASLLTKFKNLYKYKRSDEFYNTINSYIDEAIMEDD
jgi:hypothetical protein